MKLKHQDDIDFIWGTPVFTFTWPNATAINAELKALVLERRASQPALHANSHEGWRSSDDFLKWPSPAVHIFQGWIIEAFKKVTQSTSRGQDYSGSIRISSWANVNHAGDFKAVHKHPNSGWSGMYYVEVHEPEDKLKDLDLKGTGLKSQGQIYFQDPRCGAGMCPDAFNLFGQERSLQPTNGQMLLFPSWLPHGLSPCHGKGERISIAFNIALLDLM
ncbi:MAG: TIGR02466 family protein [Rhodospirillaceae bacterium]